MRLLITMILTLVLSCSKNTESNDVEYSYEESDPTEVSDQDGSEVHTSFTNPALNLQGSSLSISLAVSEIKTASPVSSFSLKGTKEKRETKHDVGKGATKQGDKLSTKDIVSVTLDVQRLVFVKSNGDEEVADVNQRLEYSDLSNITSLFSHELDPNDFNSIKIYLGDGNKVSYRDSDGIETDVLKIKHPKHKYVTIQHPFHVIENVQTEISVDFNLSKSIVYNKVHGWNLKPHFQVTASQLLPVGSGVLRCEDDFVVYGSPNSEWHKAANVQEALELASEGDTIEISRSPADTNLLVLEKTGLTLMSSCNARLSNLTIKDSKNIMIASLELTAIAEGQQSILVEGSNSNIILVSNTISTRLAGINGLASTGEVSSLSIFNNKIVNNGSYGIVLRGSYDNIAIQGNSISNNSLSALKMEGKFLGKIVDNTIMFNGSSNPQEGYGIDYREVSQSSSLIVSENQFYKNNGTIVPNSSRDIASIFSAITEYEDVNNMTSDGKEDSQISPFYVESLCSSNLTKSIYHDYSNKFVLWKKGIWNQQESFIESASNPDNKLEIRPHLTGVYDISIESEEGIEPRVDFYSSNLNGFDEKSVVLEADGVTSIGSYYIGCGSVFRLASPDPLKIKSIKFEKKEQMDAVDRLVSKDVGATLEVPGQLEIYVEPGILDNDTLIGIAKAEMPADLPDSIVSVGSSYEMSPSGLQFSDDGLSVSLYYDKDEVNKLTDDPHKLTLITKNIEGEWVAIDSHVEPEIGRISGRMRHFSPLLIVYGWNLTTASCELKKLHIDWPLTDLSMKIEDECVSRAVTDAALNLLNRSGYKTGLQEEFSGDYRMMYIEAPAASMENGKIIVNFGIKTWFRTKLFSIDDKVHYSSKQRIDLNLKLIFSTKIINGKFQYVFLFPLLDLDISNVGDADDFLTAMIHGVAAFANTYFNFSNNMDVYLDELIFNALSFVVIFNNFTLSQMYQTIYGINGNNQLKSDIKKLNYSFTIQKDYLEIKANLTVISNLITLGFQQVLNQALASNGISTAYGYDDADLLLELAVETHEITTREIINIVNAFITTYGFPPTPNDINIELSRARIYNNFVKFGDDRIQLNTIYKVGDNSFCRVRDEKQLILFGNPIETRVFGTEYTTFEDLWDQGTCSDPHVGIIDATHRSIKASCVTGKTSNSGSRRSCYSDRICLTLNSPHGFIFHYEYTGNTVFSGSEHSCNEEKFYNGNGDLSSICVTAYARSHTGYNAAAGWATCEIDFYIFDTIN